MQTTHALEERLQRFAQDLEGLLLEPTRASVETMLAELRRLFALEKRVEAEHITLGVDDGDFPFAAAQAELQRSRLDFARIARELALAAETLLSVEERKEVETMAFLAERAPLTSARGLDAIREGRRLRALGSYDQWSPLEASTA